MRYRGENFERLTGFTERLHFAHALEFPVYCLVPGGRTLVNFGDAGGPSGAGPALVETAKMLAVNADCPLAPWYLRQIGVDDWRVRDLAARGPAALGLPSSKAFASIGWVTLRTGWEDDAVLLAFKAGTPVHHNHLDQNSFVVGTQGEWMANDPGYQRYHPRYYPKEPNQAMILAEHGYSYGSLGHNTLLVDGEGQVAKEGRLELYFGSPGLDVAVGDAAACYATLSVFKRFVISVKPGYFLVFDWVVTDGEERRLEWLLHTDPRGRFVVEGEVMVPGVVTTADHFVVTKADEEEDAAGKVQRPRLAVEILWPTKPSLRVQQPEYTAKYGSMVSIEGKAPIRHGEFLTAICKEEQDGTSAARFEVVEEVELSHPGRVAHALALRAEGAGYQDRVLLSPLGALFSADGVLQNGIVAWIRHDTNARLVEWGLVAGTVLRENEGDVFRSNRSVSCVGQRKEHAIELQLAVTTQAVIGFACSVAPTEVFVDGRLRSRDDGYTFAEGQCTLEIDAGDHWVRCIMGQPGFESVPHC